MRETLSVAMIQADAIGTNRKGNAVDVLLVGYGTLLHRGSLGQSIGGEAADEKDILPVRIRDYRRVFNLRPTHYPSSFKLSGEGIENAAMNVEVSPGAFFNALAFKVTSSELDILDERERYYERHVVPLFDFGTDAPIGEGHVYSSAPEARWIERDPQRLLPLWRDIVWARTGAYGVGEKFGREYDATTYLADGRTLMVDRYRHVLDQTDDVEPPR